MAVRLTPEDRVAVTRLALKCDGGGAINRFTAASLVAQGLATVDVDYGSATVVVRLTEAGWRAHDDARPAPVAAGSSEVAAC